MGRGRGGNDDEGGGFTLPWSKRKGNNPRDADDTHYSDKTGHKARGISAKQGLKRREQFLKEGD
jgi:hypothetical protein